MPCLRQRGWSAVTLLLAFVLCTKCKCAIFEYPALCRTNALTCVERTRYTHRASESLPLFMKTYRNDKLDLHMYRLPIGMCVGMYSLAAWWIKRRCFISGASKLICLTNIESECDERHDGQCYCETRGRCYKSVSVFYEGMEVDSYTEYGCLKSLFVSCEEKLFIASPNTVLACCSYNNCSVDLELDVSDALDLLPKPPSFQSSTSYVVPSTVSHSTTTTPTVTGVPLCCCIAIQVVDCHPPYVL